jgi:hypothetical protein
MFHVAGLLTFMFVGQTSDVDVLLSGGASGGGFIGAAAQTGAIITAGPSGAVGIRWRSTLEATLELRSLLIIEEGIFGAQIPTLSLGARFPLGDIIEVTARAGPSLMIAHGIAGFFFAGASPGFVGQLSGRVKPWEHTALEVGASLGAYQTIGITNPFGHGLIFFGVVYDIPM